MEYFFRADKTLTQLSLNSFHDLEKMLDKFLIHSKGERLLEVVSELEKMSEQPLPGKDFEAELSRFEAAFKRKIRKWQKLANITEARKRKLPEQDFANMNSWAGPMDPLEDIRTPNIYTLSYYIHRIEPVLVKSLLDLQQIGDTPAYPNQVYTLVDRFMCEGVLQMTRCLEKLKICKSIIDFGHRCSSEDLFGLDFALEGDAPFDPLLRTLQNCIYIKEYKKLNPFYKQTKMRRTRLFREFQGLTKDYPDLDWDSFDAFERMKRRINGHLTFERFLEIREAVLMVI
jgi:hypothetical protein